MTGTIQSQRGPRPHNHFLHGSSGVGSPNNKIPMIFGKKNSNIPRTNKNLGSERVSFDMSSKKYGGTNARGDEIGHDSVFQERQ